MKLSCQNTTVVIFFPNYRKARTISYRDITLRKMEIEMKGIQGSKTAQELNRNDENVIGS